MTPSASKLTTSSATQHQTPKVPAVVKIVYSTCSVHAAENEDVVDQALSSEEAKLGNFRLAPSGCVLPTWTRRGLPESLRESAGDLEGGASDIAVMAERGGMQG